MRFAELNLIKYGHFDGCTLTFPSGPTDLQLIYGPNEAGKTTTRSAIRDLLFGFGRRTNQDYRFDRALLRVGAVISDENGQLVIRRRKGDVRTLLDEGDQPLADNTLTPYLHGYDADAFERMFSLDHARLRQGGSEIIAGEGSVGEAIFSAGAGLAGIAQLCDDLEEQAKGIWARTHAQGRKYYVAQAAYDEAKARLKQALVKPAKWDAARREYEHAASEVDEAQSEFERTLADHATVERKRRLVVPVSKLLERRVALSDLGDIPELPTNAEETCQACLSDIAAAGVRRQVASETLDRVNRELVEIEVPDALLRALEDIGTLRERKSVIEDYISDLPKRRAARDIDFGRLRALQAELEWPTESAEKTRDRLPARGKSAEVRELVERRAGLDERLSAARRNAAQATETVALISRRLAALGPAIDVSAATVTSRRLRSAGDSASTAKRAQRAADQLKEQLTASLSRLAPWTGTAAELRALPLPDEGEVSARSEAIEEARRASERAASALAKSTADVELAALELRQALEAGDPVLPETLADARRLRDQTWHSLRRWLLGGGAPTSPPQDVERYEGEVGDADRLADRRVETSQAAALALARRQDFERAELAAAQARADHERAARAEADALEAWRALVAVVDAELDVAAFQAWRGRAREALGLADRLDAAQEEVLQADAVVRSTQMEVATLARQLGIEVAERAGGAVLDEVDAHVEQASTTNTERKALQQQLEQAEVAAERTRAELDQAEADISQWQEAWTKRVTEANLGQSGRFAVVRQRLTLLDEVRELVATILDLERRIGSMEQEIEQFSADVDNVATACEVTLDQSMECVAHLASLVMAAETAKQLDSRRTELTTAGSKAQQDLADADAEARTAEARLTPLLELAGVSAPRDLIPVVDRWSRARALTHEIGELENEVIAAGDGGTLVDLIELARSAEPALLTAESERIERRLSELRSSVQLLSEEKQRYEMEFRAMDVGPDAAVAEADMVQARAEMEFQAEAYVQRRAEAVLLRWVMERFRRERQAPLLREASEIFSRLTLGRYSGLDVEVEGRSGHLIGLLADGERTVQAAHMSDGTADQLYLALRLAAVREAVESGAKLPFIADDLFVNYDDDRAAAGFRELAELAKVTQVLFLTHHEHLLEVAGDAVAPLQVSSCALGGEQPSAISQIQGIAAAS